MRLSVICYAMLEKSDFMKSSKGNDKISGKILIVFFCVFILISILVMFMADYSSNKYSGDNFNEDVSEVDSDTFESVDTSDSVVNKDRFAEYVKSYVEKNLISNDYEIDAKTVNGDDVSLNFVFKTVKTKNEYSVIAEDIYDKIKYFLKLVCISDADYFDSNSVFINFYVNEDVLTTLINHGRFDKDSYYIHIPYEIGGCTIHSTSGMFTEAVFDKSSENLINFYGYIE